MVRTALQRLPPRNDLEHIGLMIGEAVDPRTRSHQIFVPFEPDPAPALTQDREHLKSLPLLDRKWLERFRTGNVEHTTLLARNVIQPYHHVLTRFDCRGQEPAGGRLMRSQRRQRDTYSEAELCHSMTRLRDNPR